jgi:hypothetical protein
MVDTPSISQLSLVISQAIAPAFILGAVAGFISVLVTRLNRVIDRCRIFAPNNQKEGDYPRGRDDLARLNARANLINRALFAAIASALASICLMILAFADAFFDLPHERGVAILFVVALLLFGASLVNFGREIWIVIKDPNNFD